MKKVSFDFDSTLDRKDVQDFCYSLILKGFDVWICTSRKSPDNAPEEGWNDDLFEVADRLGIKRENIIFTNHVEKYKFLDDSFMLHLDDDWIELNMINSKTNVKGISQFGNSSWKQKCKRILNI